MNKPRRHFSAPEKVALLKRHLLEKTPISDLCDEVSGKATTIGDCVLVAVRTPKQESGHPLES